MDNLKYEFEESDLLFQVDILDWNELSKGFQNIINKGYEVIYSSKHNS
jgi:type I restriction enzyme S subunit